MPYLTSMLNLLSLNSAGGASITETIALRLLLALSSILFFFGFGMILFSVYTWADLHYSTPFAAGITGMLAIVFAILAALPILTIKYVQYRQFEKIKTEITTMINEFVAIAEEDLAEPVKENPKSSVMAASLAGYATGKQIF